MEFTEDSRKRLVSMSRNHANRTKEDFTQKLREDREKRLEEKKREKNAIIIQKYVRSYLARHYMRKEFKVEFLQKIQDLKKLATILSRQQQDKGNLKFATRSSVMKLVRYCLFVGDFNDRDMVVGLLVAINCAKPIVINEEPENLRNYRNSQILIFLLRSKIVTIRDVDHFLRQEGPHDDFVFGRSSFDACLRAVSDQSFAVLANKCIQSADKIGLHKMNMKAFLMASQVDFKKTGLLFADSSAFRIRNKLYSDLSAWTTNSSSFPRGLYTRYPEIKLTNLEATFNAIVATFPFQNSVNEDVGSFSKAIGIFFDKNIQVESLSILGEPTKVSSLLNSCKNNTPALFAICCFFTQIIDRYSVSDVGISVGAKVLLGGITPQESPPICLVWKAIINATEEDRKLHPPQVLNFACMVTKLLLEVMDDEDLFLKPNRPFSLEMIEGIALYLKDRLYEHLWVQSTKPPEALVDFFSRLYERCARHSSKINNKVWLFPTIPATELGLGSTSARPPKPLSADPNQMEEEEGEDDEGSNLLTSASARGQQILRTCPMVIPFEQRVLLFNRHLEQHKLENPENPPIWNEMTGMVEIPFHAQATLRRDHVVEDAYKQLGGSSLSGKINITFVSDLGLEEAGIGPGPFKEFITNFCQEAFDPEKGLFQINNETGQLYPAFQPNLKLIEFIGAILGKAVYENILVEPELAPFVLNLVRGKKNGVHDLQSLDMSLYKNLISIKGMNDETLESLGLTFTVFSSSLNREIELVPGGKNILVNKENRTFFIERVADYRLNRELDNQIQAFSKGFQTMIESSWVRLFSAQEFAMLIGGTAKDIDVTDMRVNTKYNGGYHPSQPYIQDFWNIIEFGLTAEQRSKLLKFVTSCSRPPLAGFASLQPNITIYQVRNDTERLPTSSTCVNLLKLPKYADKETLRQKLILAIESESGFELS